MSRRGTIQYRFEIRLADLGSDPLRPIMVRHMMEFWAQDNCIGRWKTNTSKDRLSLGLSTDQDAVAFKIGPIYARFASVLTESRATEKVG